MKPAHIIALLLLVGTLLPEPASAAEPIYARSKDRIAVRGYDVVAYFTKSAPIKGVKTYSYRYKNATWLFSSQLNLSLFKSNPEKYTPQYGGYCAYAAAKPSIAASKPQYFTVYKGKLYLNFGKDVNDKWLRGKDKYIEQADKNWPALIQR